MKNCRTCTHAKWKRDKAGRRMFNYYAQCLAPINMEQLPASAWEAVRILEKDRGVAEHGDKPVDCYRWVGI